MASALWLLWRLFWQLLGPIATFVFLVLLVIVASLAYSHHATIPRVRRKNEPVHLLLVLGSGGHTAEMLSMMRNISLDPTHYTYRTYVVSSGDDFSAKKAREFESDFLGKGEFDYDIVTIPRARRVHQSYWTTPLSTIQCLWACFDVLLGRYPGQKRLPRNYLSPQPDLIITNGPAVGFCVVLVAKMIRFYESVSRWMCGSSSTQAVSRLRTIFVESWARINGLSTTGVLLLPLADVFLVQWRSLAGRRAWPGMKQTQYAGAAVLPKPEGKNTL
ncbi:glycosyltransferase family protein [Penicillium sp. IBT 18751x]|nr:glycosyltransferase family protein [Penicillium sp. IBT 18751x]